MTRFYAGNPKKYYREKFKDDSDRLFNYAWKVFLGYLRHSITIKSELEVIEWIRTIMSVCVNNPRSSFYIYGK